MEGLNKLACSDITESTPLKKNSNKASSFNFRHLVELTDLESEMHHFMKRWRTAGNINGEMLTQVSLENYFLQTRMTLCTILRYWNIIFEKASKLMMKDQWPLEKTSNPFPQSVAIEVITWSNSSAILCCCLTRYQANYSALKMEEQSLKSHNLYWGAWQKPSVWRKGPLVSV